MIVNTIVPQEIVRNLTH